MKALLVAVALTSILPSEAMAMSVPSWLYSVEQTVADQSAGERQRVAREGLLTVLSRLTGLESVPRSQPVRSALANPSRFYSEYKFFDNDGDAMVRITFQKTAVMNLIRTSALPIWWTSRPTVLVWVAVEENGRRQILAADSDHPLRGEIEVHAKRRGLEVRLPLMDVDDELSITPGAVWGDVASSVQSASSRYDADMVMTCRLKAALSLAGRALDGDCRYWFADSPIVDAFSTPQFNDVAKTAVDGIAGLLVDKYSVLARDLRRWEVRIAGADDVSDYAMLLRYVENLDFVDQVTVSQLEPDHFTFLFDTRADADQFLMLLTSDGSFLVDNLDEQPGVRLVWRG
ncbi:MAG: DUF2066 domain-containing protein [Pseudomonadales bacterium]|nr:DUF2066 domain-containing protein [Pseudomonadales bacterium]